MIPEEAIEAAARASFDYWQPEKIWADNPDMQSIFKADARMNLEAAAPHMLAVAKAEALAEAADYLDKPRVVWYDHEVGVSVMQKEGDYSSLVALTIWLRTQVAAYQTGLHL